MARSKKHRRSHRRSHYYERNYGEKKRSSDFETVRRLSFYQDRRQVDDEPRRKARPDYFQTVVHAPATKAAVYAFDPYKSRVDPPRIVRRKELLNCRQKSQRPTEKPRFSSGGISKIQWAISRKQREERCK